MEKVVCIRDFMSISINKGNFPKKGLPIKGEIYTVTGIHSDDFGDFYYLHELSPKDCFLTKAFRPVDQSYGPAICSTIEEQIQLEEVITI